MLYAKKETCGKWGFVDEKNEPICNFIYDEVRNFSEGIAAVRIDDKWGYINETGSQICEIRYEAVGDFQMKKAKIKEMYEGIYQDEYDKIASEYTKSKK